MKYKKLKVDLKTPLEKQLKELGIYVPSYIDLSLVSDLVPSVAEIHDVEDGEEMMGISSDEAVEKFKDKNRRGLTLREVLAVIRENPRVLQHHNIDCPGSRCRAAGEVPVVCLSDDEPGLGWGYASGASPRWGAASCGSEGSLGLVTSDLESRIASLEAWSERITKA